MFSDQSATTNCSPLSIAPDPLDVFQEISLRCPPLLVDSRANAATIKRSQTKALRRR